MPELTPDRSLRRPPPDGARERLVGAGRRRRAALAGAAALILAVPLAAGLVVTRQGSEDALVAAPGGPAADCPAELPVADQDAPVPAPPAPGPADRLVPDVVPDAVLVCRYADSSSFAPGRTQRATSVALEGERQLDEGLERLPDDLAVHAGNSFGFCTQMGGATVPHLVRLDYASGPVWLATSTDPNSCALVTNGAFTSAVYLGGQVAASYDARAWVNAVPRFEDTCRLNRTGRAGQEGALVPAGWSALELCKDGALQPVPDERAAAVADLLGSLTTRDEGGSGASCQDQLTVPGAEEHLGMLVWRYPSGRDVLTFLFLGCEPPVGSATLSATATLQEQTELVRLLRGD